MMNTIRGIAILGMNGSGKSTLAHMLAKETGYLEMDAEDYYFPEQRPSRLSALEHNDSSGSVAAPFSTPRSREEVQAAILTDIRLHPKFILTAVTANWDEEICAYIDIAFLLRAPVGIRMKRIEAREQQRFGERVLPGGDMFESQAQFRDYAAKRDPACAEESAKRLSCPVIFIDGTLSPDRILIKMLEYLAEAKSHI